jgi:hypothetical protein
MTAYPCHIHFDRGQNLPDLIVQVSSDPCAILFAYPLQTFRQSAPLAFTRLPMCPLPALRRRAKQMMT